jgi:serine/threonine protein phosphatase PrpC
MMQVGATMHDSVWIAIVAGLVFALVYTWARKAPAPAPKEATPKPKAAAAKKKKEPEPEPEKPKPAKPADDLPKMNFEEDSDVDPTKVGMAPGSKRAGGLQPPTKRIVADTEAAAEEPTNPGALILVTAMAQTDRGLKRKRNEDSILAMVDAGLYVVADGMGGYRGGEIASSIAVKTVQYAFERNHFAGAAHDELPSRASELARAVQMANEAILDRAESQKELEGMGTTVCAARFSPNKQRLYIAHVGDSRMYRLRDGKLKQLTSDHTMKDLGVTGEAAAHLSRAVGIWPTVPIDVILCKPRPSDIYILCSDGLSKMVPDTEIAEIVSRQIPPNEMVDALIHTANEHGGKDNVSVIVVRVDAAVSVGSVRPR